MGKVAATELKKKKKKKGRPSLLDLQKRALEQDRLHRHPSISSKPNFTSTPARRSASRNPNPPHDDSPPSDGGTEGEDEDEDDDDDDERKEKKVKLVGRFPPSSDHQHFNVSKSSANSLSHNSASAGHESSADEDNHEASTKKQKINAGGGRSRTLHAAAQDKKFQKATVAVHGNSLDSGPTTPLPDKKLLIFIIDRLRKKDTYGVFSEPVDPNELPDYHEIIENPMDFGTLRNKLDDGMYTNFEDFEADVFLICSNAMQYNASDTIYFRQAKTIRELAKRDFENLREVNEEGEPQPKVVRRGRPPSKNVKKEFVSPPPPARFGPESSSDATPTTGGENQNVPGSNNYNLRKGPMSYKFRPNDVYVGPSHLSGSNDFHDWASDWNTEFPASVLKAEAKHVKKTFMLDENKRSTYKLSQASTLGDDPYMLTSLNGQTNRLMGVGVHVEHGYSRSLARFAANLGPLAWKIASKKIESVLPSGVKFGPGWIGESEETSQQTPPTLLSEQQKSPSNSVFDTQPHSAIPNSSMNNELSYGGGFIQQQQKRPSDSNGYNSTSLAGDVSFQSGMVNNNNNLEDASFPSQTLPGGLVPRNNCVPIPGTFPKYQQNSCSERQYSLPVAAPDLNTGSSSSGLQIGSSSASPKQQPDLALQL